MQILPLFFFVMIIANIAWASPLNFISLGDWGLVNDDQAKVAIAVSDWATKSKITFLLSLGDNFYEDGVASDTDPQWQTTYQNVFAVPALQVPWYAILGNHDRHNGRGQGQIDFYKNKRDNRWVMKDYYYDQVVPIAGTNQTLHMVFIDTCILTKSSNCWYPGQPLPEPQLAWLNSTLAASTADWLFVIGHFPVFSGGEHGDSLILINSIKPMLDVYNVDAYLSGHDHTLQHLQSGQVNYFVSGNGCKRGEIMKKTPETLFGVVDPGFMLHTIDNDVMTSSLVDLNGQTIYSFNQTRTQKQKKNVHQIDWTSFRNDSTDNQLLKQTRTQKQKRNLHSSLNSEVPREHKRRNSILDRSDEKLRL